MNILKRFGYIMSANINDILDKMENPEKMIDQYLRNLDRDLAEVKANTATVISTYKKAVIARERCQQDIVTMLEYTQRAHFAGNEEDAKIFFSKKIELETQLSKLFSAEEIALRNKNQMLQLHDKLVSDINVLKARRDNLKAKISIANAKDIVSKTSSALTDSSKNIEAFARLESKIDDMLEIREIEEELEDYQNIDNLEELKKRYEKSADVRLLEEYNAFIESINKKCIEEKAN